MIGLIACAATKLDRPAPACELYVSPLFRLSLAYARTRCDTVYVLSALHGLVHSDEVIRPYDRKLGGKRERLGWGQRVASHLIDRHGVAYSYLFLAGEAYTRPVASALRTYYGDGPDGWRGVPRSQLHEPLAGMTLGFRLRWLSQAVHAAHA